MLPHQVSAVPLEVHLAPKSPVPAKTTFNVLLTSPLLMELLVGGISVGGATFATNPLDVVKGE
jgi:hypothetical protein